MNQSTNDTLNENRTEFINQLCATTVEQLQAARDNRALLVSAVEAFYKNASSANLELSEMEDILGVNESCIMDEAGLSEADEEIVMDTFESLAYG